MGDLMASTMNAHAEVGKVARPRRRRRVASFVPWKTKAPSLQRSLVLALPLLLFALACGLCGLWAVFAQSRSIAQSSRGKAQQEASRYTNKLELVVQNIFVPARALQLLVRWTPGHNIEAMRQSFDDWAERMLRMTGWQGDNHVRVKRSIIT